MNETDPSLLDVGTEHLSDGVRLTHFFNGRILTAEALVVEQEGAALLRRRLGQCVGSGVVCGLEVEAVGTPATSDLPEVVVRRGLALSATGETLVLPQESLHLRLRPEPHSAVADPQAGFVDCGVGTTSVFTDGESEAHVLVVGPASGYEGRVPLAVESGLEGSCGTRDVVSGLRFRLVPLPPLNVPMGGDQRSRLAHFCLGSHTGVALDPLEPETTSSEGSALAMLRAAGDISSSEVALALIRIEGNETAFVDTWAVRRLLALEGAPLAPSRAVAWAALRHFQDHLDDLGPDETAQQHLAYLPSFGRLRRSLDGLEDFLPGVPLQVPSLLWRSQVVALRRAAADYPVRSYAEVQSRGLALFLLREDLVESSGGATEVLFASPEVACLVCAPVACVRQAGGTTVVSEQADFVGRLGQTAGAYRHLARRMVDRVGALVAEQPSRDEWLIVAQAEVVAGTASDLAGGVDRGATNDALWRGWKSLVEQQLRITELQAVEDADDPLGGAFEDLKGDLVLSIGELSEALEARELCAALGLQADIDDRVGDFDFEEEQEAPEPIEESVKLVYRRGTFESGKRLELGEGKRPKDDSVFFLRFRLTTFLDEPARFELRLNSTKGIETELWQPDGSGPAPREDVQLAAGHDRKDILVRGRFVGKLKKRSIVVLEAIDRRPGSPRGKVRETVPVFPERGVHSPGSTVKVDVPSDDMIVLPPKVRKLLEIEVSGGFPGVYEVLPEVQGVDPELFEIELVGSPKGTFRISGAPRVRSSKVRRVTIAVTYTGSDPLPPEATLDLAVVAKDKTDGRQPGGIASLPLGSQP